METNNIDSILKAKELLNKLLKEHLDKNLSKLEINNQKELKSISLIKITSKKLLKNVLQYSKISLTKDSKGKKMNKKISKLNIHINHTKSQMNINNKYQNSKKGELDSILKNRRYTNKRNREDSLSTLIGNNNTNNTLQSKVSFIDKSKKKPTLTVTPVRLGKSKTFVSHTTSTRREKPSFNKTAYDNFSSIETGKLIKLRKKSSKKNLFEKYVKIKNINEKIKKLYKNNNNVSFNSSNNAENKSISNKKVCKTALNFYSKKSKNNFYKSVDSNTLKDNNLKDKKIIDNENNLKTLCDSLLNDVIKDELLVNNSKIFIKENIGNETELRKISFSSVNDKDKNEMNNNYYDNLKICIQYILKFLNINEILSLAQTKKEILKIVMNIQIKNIIKSIDEINIIIKNKNININDSSISKRIKPFELNINSIKAISLLNSISKANFIKSIMAYKNQNIKNNNVIKKILLIFDIYFIAVGKKKILNSFNGNNNKIEYICNYFKNNKNKSIGTIIENDLNGRKFDDFIINSLYECSHEYIKIINPTYYKKLNKDIAILVFLIKNILDYVGLSYIESKIQNNNKNNEQKIHLICKSRINVQNIVLNKYNNILNKYN